MQSVVEFEERLSRRYASAVKGLAKELGIQVGRKSKRALATEVAEMLATGCYPQVVIDWRLYDVPPAPAPVRIRLADVQVIDMRGIWG